MQVSMANSNIPSAYSHLTHGTRLAARIGGISLGLAADSRDMDLMTDPSLRGFLVDESCCEMEFRVGWRDGFGAPEGDMLFDSGGLWQAFGDREGYCFRFTSASLGPEPYKQARVSRDFTHGRIELLRPCFPASYPANPLEYPLDELLWTHRLAHGEGVEVHACGVVTPDGRGLLLTGHSGAGKSTSARLWSSLSGVRVLSDDRIILRRDNGRMRMYGTPWHGDAGISEAASCPLDAIFALAHGDANRLGALGPAAASAELYARSFLPHYLAEAVSFVLGFLDKLVSEVPCREFVFVPDLSAVEALLHEKT